MGKLERLARNVIGLDVDKIAFKIFSRQDVKAEIIRLNTKEQLFKRGIRADGVKLADFGGGYSDFTINKKLEKGQPIDRVTLFDTGDFHNSFRVEPGIGFFIISSDPQKDDTNLLDEWGPEVEGLTVESKNILIDFIRDKFIQEVKARIQQGL